MINEEIPKNIDDLEKGIQEDINNFEEISKTEYEKEKTSHLTKLYEVIEKYNQYIFNIVNDIDINEFYTFPDYMAKTKEYLQEMNTILKEKQNSNTYKSLYDNNNSIEIYAIDYSGNKILDTFEIIKI